MNAQQNDFFTQAALALMTGRNDSTIESVDPEMFEQYLNYVKQRLIQMPDGKIVVVLPNTVKH